MNDIERHIPENLWTAHLQMNSPLLIPDTELNPDRGRFVELIPHDSRGYIESRYGIDCDFEAISRLDALLKGSYGLTEQHQDTIHRLWGVKNSLGGEIPLEEKTDLAIAGIATSIRTDALAKLMSAAEYASTLVELNPGRIYAISESLRHFPHRTGKLVRVDVIEGTPQPFGYLGERPDYLSIYLEAMVEGKDGSVKAMPRELAKVGLFATVRFQ